MAPNVALPCYDVTKQDKNQQQQKDDDGRKTLKCVVLGDGAVGKTSLIISYTTNGYPTEYQPTAYDNYSVKVDVNQEKFHLEIHDTAGQDDFDHIRPLCYPGCDVIMICFSVVNPTSLVNVKEKWLPEVRKYLPKLPIILVGTQTDLKANVDILIDLNKINQQVVTEEQGWRCAKEIGAIDYIECSSVLLDNLKQAFDIAIEQGVQHQHDVIRRQKRLRVRWMAALKKKTRALRNLSCFHSSSSSSSSASSSSTSLSS